MLKSFRNRKSTQSKPASKKRLRLESLEDKAMLAGDVAASVLDGDLFITGDAADNEFEIVRDVTQAAPGIGEITIRGLAGTTINGLAEVTFNGADAATGDVELDLTAGGIDFVAFNGTATDSLVFLDDFRVIGGSLGQHRVELNNVEVGDDLTHTSLAALEAVIDLDGSSVGGDVLLESTAALSELVVFNSDIAGNTLLDATVGAESVLDVLDSTFGGDLVFRTTTEFSEAIATGFTVADDLVLELLSDGGSDVNINDGNSIARNTVGDDLLITTTAALDFDQITIDLTDVGDDLRADLGDGENIFELVDVTIGDDLSAVDGDNGTFFSEYIIEFTTIGDDAYVVGNGGDDQIVFDNSTIGDNLRVSAGGGEDEVVLEDSSVEDVVISLGDDLDEAGFVNATAERIRLFGRGDNEIVFLDVVASHSVTILTASGEDVVEIGNLDTRALLVAVGAGDDQVIIGSNAVIGVPPAIVDNSEIDLLFVFLGAGNDSLELDGIDATFALLSGGSGEDSLVDAEDANDITFSLDFAFEDFPA